MYCTDETFEFEAGILVFDFSIYNLNSIEINRPSPNLAKEKKIYEERF
ncbi:hypothetical protein LEP1GSC162_1859 [Leptospira santarosai str. CBC1531]|nr:hypothetical protein LEP1GSC162_1859 [Leptospira santarosai str. CBC1531]